MGPTAGEAPTLWSLASLIRTFSFSFPFSLGLTLALAFTFYCGTSAICSAMPVSTTLKASAVACSFPLSFVLNKLTFLISMQGV